MGHPFHMFFDWLDSKGEAEGNPLPDIPECPRSTLDSDTVLYITNPDISATYALDIVADPVDGSAIILQQDGQNPVNTGNEGWIFILRAFLLVRLLRIDVIIIKSRLEEPPIIRRGASYRK